MRGALSTSLCCLDRSTDSKHVKSQKSRGRAILFNYFPNAPPPAKLRLRTRLIKIQTACGTVHFHNYFAAPLQLPAMASTAYRPPREPLVGPGQIDHHVADMTFTAHANVSLEQIQATLCEQNQWLAIDGPSQAPIGDLVECNSTGPLRLGYGAWRDLLLGCQFNNGKGELITAGGRTMKNVAGYDLTKFMVGQRGIFGKIVTITARTYRRPVGALLAEFEPHSQIVNQILPTSLRPQWAIRTADAVACGYLGNAAELDFWQAKLSDWTPRPRRVVRRGVDEDAAHRAELWRWPDQSRSRIAVPPQRIGDFVAEHRLENWCADAAFGIIIASDQSPAPPPLPPATTMDLLGRLKHAFDPDDKLSPLPWT